jgi:hypothetical protein
MPGLDPGIHPSSQEVLSKKMDCRVKPGNDVLSTFARPVGSIRVTQLLRIIEKSSLGASQAGAMA